MPDPKTIPPATPEDALAHLEQEFPEEFAGPKSRGTPVTVDSDLQAEARVDSLTQIEMILALEDRYEVDLPDETVESVRTVRQLAELCAAAQGQPDRRPPPKAA